MSVLNPYHPITQMAQANWYKLLTIAMHKLGQTKIEISKEDLIGLQGRALAINSAPNGDLVIEIISDDAANTAAKESAP